MKFFRKNLIFIFYLRQNQLKIHLYTTILSTILYYNYLYILSIHIILYINYIISIPYSFCVGIHALLVRDKYINSKSKIN